MKPGGKKGGMKKFLKQAEALQRKMEEMQAALAEKEVEASAGGGMVTAKVNGRRDLIGLTISPEAVDPDDVEMLQDLVIAAVNEAMRKAEAEQQAQMSDLLPPGMMGGGMPGGGMPGGGIPGLF